MFGILFARIPFVFVAFALMATALAEPVRAKIATMPWVACLGTQHLNLSRVERDLESLKNPNPLVRSAEVHGKGMLIYSKHSLPGVDGADSRGEGTRLLPPLTLQPEDVDRLFERKN